MDREVPQVLFRAMLATATLILDWLGIVVFAITGGLVASRKEMDIVGFALLASVTGIGGGTIRDLLLGLTPVFWVKTPAYLLVCVLAGVATFVLAHHLSARMRLLLWLDAIGLAVFTVTGARVAMDSGAGSTIAIAMGVATATFGGVIRDVLGAESPVILRREIYVTAALAGAAAYVGLRVTAGLGDVAIAIGFAVALAIRAAALAYDLSLPRYRSTGTG
jgi:uncharacterized membrane protein YeiH